jgi:hypothetical protein
MFGVNLDAFCKKDDGKNLTCRQEAGPATGPLGCHSAELETWRGRADALRMGICSESAICFLCKKELMFAPRRFTVEF